MDKSIILVAFFGSLAIVGGIIALVYQFDGEIEIVDCYDEHRNKIIGSKCENIIIPDYPMVMCAIGGLGMFFVMISSLADLIKSVNKI